MHAARTCRPTVQASNSGGIAQGPQTPLQSPAMGTKSREVIWGQPDPRREDERRKRPPARAWSIRMEGYGGAAQPSPTIAQCLNGGLASLEVECNRRKTRASLRLSAIRRPRDTPIWKLEAALECRSCRKGRHAPPVHMIKLTATQEITP